MNILVNGIAIRGGGPETFLLGLMPQLAKVEPTSTYELLIPESRANLYEDILTKNVRITPIPKHIVHNSSSRLWFEHASLTKMLLSKRFDIHFRADELLSPLLRLVSTPSVIVYHATLHTLQPDLVHDSSLKTLYVNHMKRVAMNLSSAAIAVSYQARRELEQLYPKDSHRIKVIYHGINHDVFTQYVSNQNGRTLMPDKPYILTVSDRHPHKNLSSLVHAFGNLCRQHNIGEDLVIVGRVKSEQEEKKIQDVLSALQINERVHLIDYVKQSELSEIYHGACVFVCPSLVETFGFTPLEAMACGIPVVCSNASVMPEVCDTAVEYFDPYDLDDMTRKLLFVLSHKERQRELRDRGIIRSREFTWTRAAEQYYEVLESVVECHN